MEPARLILLDKDDPYRLVNGTVVEAFTNVDGDYHVHVNVDEQYVPLLKPCVFAISLPLYQILKVLSFMPVAAIVLYVIASLMNPGNTHLVRRAVKRGKKS